jgi:hypothetical protein
MPPPSSNQLRRFHARVGKVQEYVLQCGLFIGLGFMVCALFAFNLGARRISAWLVLPAVLSVVAIFLTTGVLMISTSLLTKRSPSGRAVNGLMLFALGTLLMWSAGAALYVFVFRGPLAGS